MTHKICFSTPLKLCHLILWSMNLLFCFSLDEKNKEGREQVFKSQSQVVEPLALTVFIPVQRDLHKVLNGQSQHFLAWAWVPVPFQQKKRKMNDNGFIIPSLHSFISTLNSLYLPFETCSASSLVKKNLKTRATFYLKLVITHL